jgi:hypothetical protein
MTERILRAIVSPDGEHRVLIVQRADGAYSYQRQWLVDSPAGREWGLPGPFAGFYDF